MPREKISAKYTSDSGEHYMGVPARDLTEDEFDALSDEQKTTLAASSFYALRHDAPKAAERAEKRIERADPAVEAPFMAAAPGPAPKVEAKK